MLRRYLQRVVGRWSFEARILAALAVALAAARADRLSVCAWPVPPGPLERRRSRRRSLGYPRRIGAEQGRGWEEIEGVLATAAAELGVLRMGACPVSC